MKLSVLVTTGADLSCIMSQEIRLVPCDGTDKWINLDVLRGKLQYGNLRVVTMTNPALMSRGLIVNSRSEAPFLKKLKKYENLDSEEWKLDDWSLDYAIRRSEKLRRWIKCYFEFMEK